MFNLIVRSVNRWGATTGKVTMPSERFFEYTDEHMRNQFKQGDNLLLDQLTRIPCLFMEEGTGADLAYVGQISRPRITGKEVSFDYTLDTEVPPLPNSVIFANRTALEMEEFEFSRNHWAVKEVDLYRFLLRNVRPRRQHPIVFQIPEHESIDSTLASAMMPFDTSFHPVYDCISGVAKSVGLLCRRADNIWQHPTIIQDVVTLIDRSRVVVCDCTGRNSNVFYETGIAHSLGREVIVITQNKQDIPFDLGHLRYIHYLNNTQGLTELAAALQSRMQTILGH